VQQAFQACTSLSNLTIPGSVTSIGYEAFDACTSITNLTIPGSLANIGRAAFQNCTHLTNVTIASDVSSIEDYAFYNCTSLTAVYFVGEAPSADSTVFALQAKGDGQGVPPEVATVYYLAGTTGWSAFSANTGVPAVLWNPLIQSSGANFGVSNNQFRFNITGTTNLTVVVEACTNLVKPVWTPLQTLTLTNGLAHFNDPNWTNYLVRFYGLGFP